MSILGAIGEKAKEVISSIVGKKKTKQLYADCIITDAGNNLLLFQRNTTDDFQGGKWCLAGGKIEEGEQPLAACIREVREETGLNVNPTFIEKVEKEDCIIYYFAANITEIVNIVLDNDEHYRHDVVPIENLDRYDTLFDLGEIIKRLWSAIPTAFYYENEFSNPISAIAATGKADLVPTLHTSKMEQVKAAFDAGEISDADFVTFLQMESSLEVLQKAYDSYQITGEQYENYFEKGKHYEFVKVTREGKTFMQYREVGTNKIEEHIEVGDTIETTSDIDLSIRKYSDKSFLITGDTLKNLQLLRDIKQDAGVGTYSRALNGWIFPLSAKSSILAKLADKMPISTYDETAAKEAVINLKNAVDVGTAVEVDGEEAEVTMVSINDAGELVYTVVGKDKKEEPVAEVQKHDNAEIDDFSKNTKFKTNPSNTHLFFNINEEKQIRITKNDKTGAGKGYHTTLHSKNDDGIGYKTEYESNHFSGSLIEAKKEAGKLYFNEIRKDTSKNIEVSEKRDLSKISTEALIKQREKSNDFSEMAGITTELNSRKSKEQELPIGSVSPDGLKVKTANGWEWIKKPETSTPSEPKQVTETEIAIPPATDAKAVELINNATEENRIKTAKELMGKEAGAEPVSVGIEKKGQEGFVADIKEFTTRSGEVVSALDYTGIVQSDIQLVDQEGILDKPKPDWCVDINEKAFMGRTDDRFVFDYVQLEGDKLILAVNGYTRETYGTDYSNHVISNDKLKDKLTNKDYSKDQIENANTWGNPSDGYTINIAGDEYKYSAEEKDIWYKDKEILGNNHKCSYAIVSIDQLVATQDYYQKLRKAEIEKKRTDSINSSIAKIATWDQKKMDYYYPFSYEKRLSDKQRKKYTKEQWEALSLDEKIKEVPFMKYPVVKLAAGHRISQLSDNKMAVSNFKMYDKFVNSKYMATIYKKEPFWNSKGQFSHDDPCYIEYQEIRNALQWRKVDLKAQREENDGSYDKALQTSYGDTNLNNNLLESHGVKIKLQNGKDVKENHEEQIKESLNAVYDSFGNRSSMAKEFGLKISHSGEKLMFARKALGLYIPSMKAIGVSDKQEQGKFGFTMAHEFAHFIDNYVGKKGGRNYASDNSFTTAGKIAKEFRSNMNKDSESDYINRSCECFARAFEQYHAMKHNGEDAIKYVSVGEPYHKDPNHVPKEKFNTLIKPLIEQFLKENDSILKSAFDELNLVDLNNNFELIKSAFDNNDLSSDVFMPYLEKYNDIIKANGGDPTHGGKLVKKTGMDKTGHKTTKWISRTQADNEDGKEGKKEPVKPISHSPSVLGAFAKETPEKELKRIINESSDEKLRQAAHAEMDRRGKKEKPQEEKKPAVKKKVEEKPKLAEKEEKMQIGDSTNVGIIEDTYGDQYQINGRWYHKSIVQSASISEEDLQKQKIQTEIQKLIKERGTGTINLYHGTDNESYDKINIDGKFGGNGISFMTHKESEAKEYGVNKAKYRNKKEGKVLAMTLPKWAVNKNKATGEYETEFQLENKDGVWMPTDESVKSEFSIK